MRLAGAFVACAIGSGFATGQEIMQFFTGQGIMSILGCIVNTIIFSWCGAIFMKHGFKYKLYSPARTIEFYFGSKFGKYVEIVFQVFLFGVYLIMISGAGATLSEFFGLPPMAGRILMSVLCCVTVVLGLTKLSVILGGLGPVITLFALFTGFYAIFSNPSGIKEAADIIPTLDITKTHGGWLWSAILYPGFNAVVVLFLSCAIGNEAESEIEARLGGLIGGIMFGLAGLIMNLGLMAKITEVWDKAVPTLVIAKEISTVFSVIFSVIICCGIYTTAVPMLWGDVRHFAEDHTRKSMIITVIIATLGLILGMTDFKVLVNTIYPASGYAGIALILLSVYKEVTARKKEQ